MKNPRSPPQQQQQQQQQEQKSGVAHWAFVKANKPLLRRCVNIDRCYKSVNYVRNTTMVNFYISHCIKNRRFASKHKKSTIILPRKRKLMFTGDITVWITLQMQRW